MPELIGNKIFLRIPSAIQEQTAGGIYIPSWMDREKYATVACETLAGETVGVSYHALFDYRTNSDDSVEYNNCHEVNGELLWVVDRDDVFARLIDNIWTPEPGWVIMCGRYQHVKTTLLLPETITKSQSKAEAIDVLSGDVCVFNEAHRCTYVLPNGAEVIVLRKEQVVMINNEPIEDKVLILPDEDVERDSNGVIIPRNVQPMTQCGRVLAYGPQVKQVQVGDKVVYPRSAGVRWSGIDGVEHVILAEGSLVMIMDRGVVPNQPDLTNEAVASGE